MSHDDDTCPHFVVLGRLEAENARLKAEVERLTKAGDAFEDEFGYLTESLRMLDNEKVILKQVLAEWNAAKEDKQP